MPHLNTCGVRSVFVKLPHLTPQLYSNAQTAVKHQRPQCGGAMLVQTLIDKPRLIPTI